MSALEPFGFAVVPGSVVHDIIRADLGQIVDLVAAAYRSHAAGQTVNPASLFLRFPDRPNARIIALPAHLGCPTPISGLKWIASYPDNVQDGRPRASAVMLLNDAATGYAARLADHLAAEGWPQATIVASTDAAIRDSHLIVFATTAPRPHIHDRSLFRHAPLVLHISLRDLAPEILLEADNIVDDIDHCLTAETSPHLAERLVGHRRFITGTLADVLDGRVRPDRQRATIFSPFGLGILDLAVGHYVYEKAVSCKSAISIENFFHDRTRW